MSILLELGTEGDPKAVTVACQLPCHYVSEGWRLRALLEQDGVMLCVPWGRHLLIYYCREV